MKNSSIGYVLVWLYAALFLVAMSGCSIAERAPFATSIILQEATVREIEASDESKVKAARFVAAAEEILPLVQGDSIQLPELKAAVSRYVLRQGMSPLERIRITAFIDLVAARIESEHGDGELDTSGVISVRDAIEVIAMTAKLYI